ncbi:MAG: hypothetical protein HYS12_28245 [Planctomycetes bacterium]|nr:hypothetical protein [Planctomycetota bacterium]
MAQTILNRGGEWLDTDGRDVYQRADRTPCRSHSAAPETPSDGTPGGLACLFWALGMIVASSALFLTWVTLVSCLLFLWVALVNSWNASDRSSLEAAVAAFVVVGAVSLFGLKVAVGGWLQLTMGVTFSDLSHKWDEASNAERTRIALALGMVLIAFAGLVVAALLLVAAGYWQPGDQR